MATCLGGKGEISGLMVLAFARGLEARAGGINGFWVKRQVGEVVKVGARSICSQST